MEKEILVKNGGGSALIVVDGQNDFILGEGALYVRGIPGESENEAIIGRINSLAYHEFDSVATTEDSHSKEHIEFSIFGPHCIKGTLGQEYYALLAGVRSKADENLKKGQDRNVISYSVAMSHQFTAHITRLRSRGIKRIFVVGWAYTHCVGESAIAYACQGFETFVIRDCTRSVPPPYGNPEVMYEKLKLYGVGQILFGQIR